MKVKHMIRELQKCDPECELWMLTWDIRNECTPWKTFLVEEDYLNGKVWIHDKARDSYNNSEDTPRPWVQDES